MRSDLDNYFQVQASINDLSKFQRIVKMVAFHPFDSAENALENINAITEHEVTDDLRVSLQLTVAKVVTYAIMNTHSCQLPEFY